MNLRVDLILKTEQRSANLLNIRTLSKIVTISLPILLAVTAASMFMDMMSLKNRMRMAEQVWQDAEPKKALVLKLREKALAHEDMLQELAGWKSAQMQWSPQLQALQRTIRPSMRLTGLRIGQALQLEDKKRPVRLFTMTIEGSGDGITAEEDVQDLQAQLRTNALFAASIKTVKIPRFTVDKDDRALRVFTLECEFAPLGFK